MSDEEEVLGEDIVGEEIGDEIDDATVNDEEDLDENYEDDNFDDEEVAGAKDNIDSKDGDDDNYGDDDFIEKYYALLEAGGSVHYQNHLSKFKLNPKRGDFWQLGMNLIKNLMDDLEKLS